MAKTRKVTAGMLRAILLNPYAYRLREDDEIANNEREEGEKMEKKLTLEEWKKELKQEYFQKFYEEALREKEKELRRTQSAIRDPRYLTPERVEAIFGISAKTLANMRSELRGPKFYKLGRKVLYKVEDVETWLGNRLQEVETIDCLVGESCDPRDYEGSKRNRGDFCPSGIIIGDASKVE